MDDNRFRYLLEQYFSNTISREDCEWLLQQLDSSQDGQQIHQIIDETLQGDFQRVAFTADRREHIYEHLLETLRNNEPIKSVNHLPLRVHHKWFGVAAVLFFMLLAGALWYSQQYEEQVNVIVASDDIQLPDNQHAILTLADGRMVKIDDSSAQLLAQEGGVKVRKAADGSVYYETVHMANAGNQTKYNTFSTPKGCSYQLVLPDGTKVWLNTASSLHFPVVFNGKERKVELKGEAYFEVAKNAAQPFSVEAKGNIIKVLGTTFNVSAYDEEELVTTTLLTGGVKVSSANQQVTLKPGQKATVNLNTQIIDEGKADTLSVMAWKNGGFRFKDASIKIIMKELSRWYDIEEVIYLGTTNDRFTGTFQRSKSIVQFFENLEKMSSIKFEIQERRVKVMN